MSSGEGGGKARQARGAISQHNTGAVLTLRCATAAEDACLCRTPHLAPLAAACSPRSAGTCAAPPPSWRSWRLPPAAPLSCHACAARGPVRTTAGAARAPMPLVGCSTLARARVGRQNTNGSEPPRQRRLTTGSLSISISHQVDQLLMTWDRLTAPSDRRAQFGASTPRAPGG